MRILLVLVAIFITTSAISQTRTTVQDGAWSSSATWGGVAPPTSGQSTITVNHAVTIDAGAYPILSPLVVDQLIVGATGNLSITNGAAMSVRNGSGIDLTVFGTFTIQSGAELLGQRSASYNTSSANTTFMVGSVHRTQSLNIPIASGYPNIDIFIQDATSSITMGVSWSQLGGLGNVIVNCPNLSSFAINANGRLSNVKNLDILDTDANNGGRFLLSNTGTSTTSISGFLHVTGNSRFLATQSGTITVNVSGDFLFNSTSTNFSANATTGSGTMNFNGGDALMSAGSWRMASGSTGKGFFNLTSGNSLTVLAGADIRVAGGGSSQGTFRFTGAGSQNLSIDPASLGSGVFNLDMSKLSGNLNLLNDLSVTNLDLTSGSLVLGGTSITSTGPITRTSGVISASSGSGFVITGTGAVPAQLTFSNNSVVSTFTLNRAVSLNLANVTLSSDITIGTLNLSNGILSKTSGTLSIEDQGLITRSAGSIIAAVNALGVYDLTYQNSASITAGVELPSISTMLRHLTFQGSSILTLNKNVTVNGNLSVLSGTLNPSTFNVSLVGDYVNNMTTTFATTSSFTFLDRAPTNTHILSGSASVSFGQLIINGALSVTADHKIFGNMTVSGSGSLLVLSGTTTFGGTSLLTNFGGLINFNNIVLSSGSQFTGPLNGTIMIFGNVSGSGSFIHNNGTVVFNGSTTLSGFRSFNHVTVNGGSALNGISNVGIDGSVVNNGTISLTGGTLTWNGNGGLSGSPLATSFNTLSIAPTRTMTVTLNGNISIGNNIVLNGNLDHQTTNTITIGNNLTGNGNLSSLGRIVFTSATATLGGTGNKSFTNLEVQGTLTSTSTASFSMIGTGSILVSGILNASGGSVIATFAGTTTLSGGGTINFKNVLITGTLTSSSGLISVFGDFTNNGMFTHNDGTIAFGNSGAPKNIMGSNSILFNNLTVNDNASAVDVSNNITAPATVSLSGIMTLSSNTVFDADGSGNSSIFTLLSTNDAPAKDGSIATIPSTSSVSGSITVQRFMGPEGKVNRYISSPVSGAIVSDLADNFNTTGFRWYDETVLGDISKGYTTIPSTSPLVSGRGYLAFMWAPFDNVNVTWDLRGPLNLNQNQGSVNLDVKHTPSIPADPNADGWNLVGNPYPSGIVWDNGVGWSKTNIAPIIYVPDIGSGVFRTWNPNTLTGDLPGGIVTMGQAFWVYANLPGASLIVNEQAKTSANGTFFRKRENGNPTAGLVISLTHNDITDNSYVLIKEGTTSSFDSDFDALKLEGEMISIAPVDKENRKLVSFVTDKLDNTQVIPLFVKGKYDGEYKINFSLLENFDGYDKLYLIDSYLGASLKISESPSYTFKFVNNNVAGSNRFFLSFSETSTQEKVITTKLFPNPVTDILTIEIASDLVESVLLFDQIGKVINIVEMVNESGVSKGFADLRDKPAGLYFIRVRVSGATHIERVVKY